MRPSGYVYFFGTLCLVLMLVSESEQQWRPQGRFGKRDPAVEGDFSTDDNELESVDTSSLEVAKTPIFATKDKICIKEANTDMYKCLRRRVRTGGDIYH